jgi:hypothetical protein
MEYNLEKVDKTKLGRMKILYIPFPEWLMILYRWKLEVGTYIENKEKSGLNRRMNFVILQK